MKKKPIKGEMRVRTYDVFSRALEEGIAYGYHRAHKHTDKPDEEAMKEAIHQAVTNAVCEYFNFGDDYDEE
jgi:hypothetical protein